MTDEEKKNDSKWIIQDTINLINSNKSLVEKIASLPKISQEDFSRLVPEPLTPTNIVIDVEQFLEEFKPYESKMVHWGKKQMHMPRYGIAMYNQDGLITEDDPTNGSMFEHNRLNPDNPLVETDFNTPTELMDLPSLRPFEVLRGHQCRSNIVKWENTAGFVKHVDLIMPTPWLVLWGCTHSEKVDVKFYDLENNVVEHTPIESGRLYLVDSSYVHDAYCINEEVYQWFVVVKPSGYDVLMNCKL